MTTARVELPPKLIPVFQGEAFIRGAWGGRGSGKTRSFALMTAIQGYRYGRAGIEGQILCAREFMNSLEDSSLEEVKSAIRSVDWLNEYYEIGEAFIRSRDGRIKFTFAGLRHNVDSIKSRFRVLLAWVDEAETVRDTSWDKLLPTLREEGEGWQAELWVTWNPESDQSATHKRFRVTPPSNAKIVEMNWRDNPWFPEGLNEQRINMLEADPDKYQWVWEGGFQTVGEAAYFARQIATLEKRGLVGEFPHDPTLPVMTAWDLGIDDYTAIWFFQDIGGKPRIIDYYEASGLGLDEIFAQAMPEFTKDALDRATALIELGRAGKYQYGPFYFPHDIKVRELGASGRTRAETVMGLGVPGRLIRVGKQNKPDDRINAIRRALPECSFNNTERVALGISRLRRYRRKENTNLGILAGPLHDESSHGADAFGEMALNWRHKTPQPEEPPPPLHTGGGVMLAGPPDDTMTTKRTRLL